MLEQAQQYQRLLLKAILDQINADINRSNKWLHDGANFFTQVINE
jgi:hypothetical protein